jgi:hypothetical protein
MGSHRSSGVTSRLSSEEAPKKNDEMLSAAAAAARAQGPGLGWARLFGRRTVRALVGKRDRGCVRSRINGVIKSTFINGRSRGEPSR